MEFKRVKYIFDCGEDYHKDFLLGKLVGIIQTAMLCVTGKSNWNTNDVSRLKIIPTQDQTIKVEAYMTTDEGVKIEKALNLYFPEGWICSIIR